jgi:hypothetical protein
VEIASSSLEQCGGVCHTMRKIRLVARLDIKGPNLIKGIHLEGLRVIGLPNEYAIGIEVRSFAYA